MTDHPSHEATMGAMSERARIVAWLRTYRPYGSDLLDEGEQCPHGEYDWNSCDDCTVDRIAKGIEDGEHHG